MRCDYSRVITYIPSSEMRDQEIGEIVLDDWAYYPPGYWRGWGVQRDSDKLRRIWSPRTCKDTHTLLTLFPYFNFMKPSSIIRVFR